MDFFHKSVLLKEAVDFLKVEKGKKFVDATIGGGGHAFEILRKGGLVLGIDRDQAAIDNISGLKASKDKLILTRGNFSDIEKIARSKGFVEVDGVLFDLGLSSYQIEKSGRGFSFLKDERLDMRMGQFEEDGGICAFDLVNKWSKEELYELFSKMGEERFALAVSDSIVRARRIKPVESTLELAEIVRGQVSEKRNIHPATKVFQAIRMAVNDEMPNLKSGLLGSLNILKTGGRIVVITFHSLEDRIVKTFFRESQLKQEGKVITRKPVVPGEMEIRKNSRSRSAKLRVFEKS